MLSTSRPRRSSAKATADKINASLKAESAKIGEQQPGAEPAPRAELGAEPKRRVVAPSCADTCVPGPPYRTQGPRIPASCVLYVPEAQGSLPRGEATVRTPYTSSLCDTYLVPCGAPQVPKAEAKTAKSSKAGKRPVATISLLDDDDDGPAASACLPAPKAKRVAPSKAAAAGASAGNAAAAGGAASPNPTPTPNSTPTSISTSTSSLSLSLTPTLTLTLPSDH